MDKLEKAAREAVKEWRAFLHNGATMGPKMEALEAALPDQRDELCEAALMLGARLDMYGSGNASSFGDIRIFLDAVNAYRKRGK